MGSKKFKKQISFIALILILAMILGTIASALTGCSAVPLEDSGNASVRVAALKGPTTIGLVNMIDDLKDDPNYSFSMYTSGTDIMAGFAAGNLDIGLVPSNMAAIMNTKVEGGVTVIDINTLGVLYCVTGDKKIRSFADLEGKTIYTTGQGAAPGYTINHLLSANNVNNCTVEFKSEPTEVASILAEDPDKIAIIPQPFVTTALLQNSMLKIAFSLDDEWAKVNSDSAIVTGVTVVSNKFLAEHKDTVDSFIKMHKESSEKATSDIEKTAELVVQQGIIGKEPIAVAAIPACNIVCITGDEMKKLLGGYYQVLFDEDPKSLGGSLPESDFYYSE